MSPVTCFYYDGRTSTRREAALDITPDGVVTVAVEGQPERRRHDLSALRIPGRVAGTPRHVRLPDGAVCEVRDNDALDALQAGAERGALPAGRRFERLVHRLDGSWRGAAAALLVTAAILLSFTEWGAPFAAGVVVSATPPEVEAVIGNNLLTAMVQLNLLEPSTIEQNRRDGLLAEFTRMREAAGVAEADLRFHSGRRLGANAFALPGGTVIVTDELVELAENDEEIIAVLAHELGHVAGRHVMRRLAQTSSMLVVWTALTGDVSVAALSFLAPDQLLAMRYSRHFEREADRFAFDYLARAGIPPSRLADILRRLEAQSGGSGVPLFARSHPGTEERARNAAAAEGRAEDGGEADE